MSARGRQKRIDRLVAEVDRVLVSDRRFLKRRPDRRHRVRLTSHAELDLNHEMTGCGIGVLPAELRHFVAVKNITPCMRTRVFLHGSADADPDVSEEVARKIFEHTVRGTGAVFDENGRPA